MSKDQRQLTDYGTQATSLPKCRLGHLPIVSIGSVIFLEGRLSDPLTVANKTVCSQVFL